MSAPTTVDRLDVTFPSGRAQCAAWWYRPGGDGPAPCVVMAHGFSMTRRDGLEPYAEAFAAAGAHVLVFDHRFLGDSGGEPRQRFRPRAQQEDWRSAMAYARTLAGVDPQRIVPWGFSFSGGHIVTLLSRGVDAAAAMVLCPFVDGLARVLATPPKLVAWVLPRAVADLAGRHTLIPVTGAPGSHAAMTLPGEAEGFAASKGPGSRWRNEISPGVFATVALFRPVRKAAAITVPLWVGRCTEDITADGAAIGRLAQRAHHAELQDLPGDHFAPFHGEGIATTIDHQVAFLRRTVL
ncbi:alpha/beta hydrolase [Paraconexibacter sp.]|uniref:alpha/beta hydrolase n=1 Tax=Paraconexibacter sp. TaxID=2949640 RepID=UPI0035624164